MAWRLIIHLVIRRSGVRAPQQPLGRLDNERGPALLCPIGPQGIICGRPVNIKDELFFAI